MAENEKKSGGGEQPQREVQQAGRAQAGEKQGATLSTRVPRGVGEPPSDAVADGAEGVASLQRAVAEQVKGETERGYRGAVVDSTPRENYTVAGVTKGLPTPETTVVTPRGA